MYLYCYDGPTQKYEDLNGNIININKQLETNKIYFFFHLLFEPNKKVLKFIKNISDVEEINSDLTVKNKVFEYNKSEKRIIEGKVVKALFSKNSIEVNISNDDKADNKNIILIKLNNNLIKDITFNGKCYFVNFQKKNNEYHYIKFSHIIIDEKTFIEIKFLDFVQLNNKYDSININNNVIPIVNAQIKNELSNVPDNNYFTVEIKYMSQGKTIHVFVVEVYKGRTNKFQSYLNLENDGFFYEFLYISKNRDNLKKKSKLFI